MLGKNFQFIINSNVIEKLIENSDENELNSIFDDLMKRDISKSLILLFKDQYGNYVIY